MATSRSNRTHEQRVDAIAAEAAAKIAADSPVEEEVVVTVEELPPHEDQTNTTDWNAGWAAPALPAAVAPTWGGGAYPESMLALVEAGVAYGQRVWSAQVRYATRLMDAVASNSTLPIAGRH